MSNKKTENQELSRDVRREMGRHRVDCGEVQIIASHGMIRLHGRVRPLRGHEQTFEEDVSNLLKALRSRSGIRDVITDWTCIL